MMIKQVFLPVTMKRDPYQEMFAQSDQRVRAAIEDNLKIMKADIDRALHDLDSALTDGFTVVTCTPIDDQGGQTLHYLLHKPEASQ